MTTVCEQCDGLGFQPAVLDHRLGGRNIHEVLSMTAAEALAFVDTGWIIDLGPGAGHDGGRHLARYCGVPDSD